MPDDPPAVARFSLSALAPPKLTSPLHLAERIHLALVRLSDGAEVFTGCDGSGKPVQGTGMHTSSATATPAGASMER